ncbi:MAG: hypothetical protein ABS84_12900 [Rubrivivax sp. SCN 71-131]|jgi:hypothetical protein|nr:MAG: hypothetical protein ABS84_12900 [Rubrivivax sp. SCN 71-131]
MTATSDHSGVRLESLQARLGARLAAGLSERAAAVPHDITERLRFGREQALRAARQRRQTTVTMPVAAVAAGTARDDLLGRGGFWFGLAAGVPLVLLILGLVLIQYWASREQVLAAAEIDAMLLSDDLPPSAWTDPGFREYMKAPKP